MTNQPEKETVREEAALNFILFFDFFWRGDGGSVVGYFMSSSYQRGQYLPATGRHDRKATLPSLGVKG